MDPKVILECLIFASGAKTDEEKARVAWRFNDTMWRRVQGAMSINFCRQFNNLLQDQKWPWVKDLYSAEEVALFKTELEALMALSKA